MKLSNSRTKAVVTELAAPNPADLSPLIAASAAARDAFYRARSRQSELPTLRLAAKARLREAEVALGEAEVLADVAAIVDGMPCGQRLEEARRAAAAAREEVELLARGDVSLRKAIDLLRDQVSERHEELSRALQAFKDPIRAAAVEKYNRALQDLRDALSVVDQLNVENNADRPSIPPIVADGTQYRWLQPSPDCLAAVHPIKAAIDEENRALRLVLLR